MLLLQLQSKGINDFLEYHIYLTRGWNPSDVSVTIFVYMLLFIGSIPYKYVFAF